jgi:hypothetical protein
MQGDIDIQMVYYRTALVLRHQKPRATHPATCGFLEIRISHFRRSKTANTISHGCDHIAKMGFPFDYAADRPDHIEQILNGLDRYNPETTAVFQDYVMQQCENQTYDCYANLALLKLCVTSLPRCISE